MTDADSIELGLIATATAVTALLASSLPGEIPLGRLVLTASALLLAQTLVRDLALLARSRRDASAAPQRSAPCMCIESALGASGIVAGGALVGTGISTVVAMAPWAWPVLVAGVTVLGYATKDFVFEWRPWRIRRDRNHLNIVVSWRR